MSLDLLKEIVGEKLVSCFNLEFKHVRTFTGKKLPSMKNIEEMRKLARFTDNPELNIFPLINLYDAIGNCEEINEAVKILIREQRDFANSCPGPTQNYFNQQVLASCLLKVFKDIEQKEFYSELNEINRSELLNAQEKKITSNYVSAEIHYNEKQLQNEIHSSSPFWEARMGINPTKLIAQQDNKDSKNLEISISTESEGRGFKNQ